MPERAAAVVRRPAAIPASHRDLVDAPRVAALTTLGPDGGPQTSVVWCDFDGESVRVNTMRGFAKERNCGAIRYPAEQAERETRVILRIRPRRVTLDAIHASSDTAA